MGFGGRVKRAWGWGLRHSTHGAVRLLEDKGSISACLHVWLSKLGSLVGSLL